jgi:hypothetical protein
MNRINFSKIFSLLMLIPSLSWGAVTFINGKQVEDNNASPNLLSDSQFQTTIKPEDITFAKHFYIDQIQACEAMDKSYTAKFNEQHTVDEVKNLIGYDWPADWEANSNSMNVRHKGITTPITRLMSGTHNAIADKNHESIIIAKSLLVDLAKADTLFNSIGYNEVKKKPGCYAGGDIQSPCWFHQYNFARDVFSNYIITALWLKDELNDQEFKIVNKYINKMYKKFTKPIEFHTEKQGFYQMANGGTGVLAYASWANNKELAANQITHKFKEIDTLFYEDGYINNNSFRGYRGQWYHSYGLDSALGFVYIAKLWGAEVPTKILDKLVKASEVANLAITDWDKFKSRKYSGAVHNKIEDPINARKHTHEQAFALDTLMKILINVELANDPAYLKKRKMKMHEGIDQLVGFNPNCIPQN